MSDMMEAAYRLLHWFRGCNLKGKVKVTITFETERDYCAARDYTMLSQLDPSYGPAQHPNAPYGFPNEILGIKFEFGYAERYDAPPMRR